MSASTAAFTYVRSAAYPSFCCGRADTDEVHVGAVRLGHVGREAQAAGRDALSEDLGQTRLEERSLAP